MDRVPPSFIDDLAEDLAPVAPIRAWHGALLVALSALATALLVELLDGLWWGISRGEASVTFFIAQGMLALLGASSAGAVIRMASPHVGNTHHGARWSAITLALLPVSALLVLGASGLAAALWGDAYGPKCFLTGTGFSLVTALALILWLRRGAPVSLGSAGAFTGMAAGAIGSFVYGLACPLDTIDHLGVWHVAPVALLGLVGRFAVPPLVRW